MKQIFSSLFLTAIVCLSVFHAGAQSDAVFDNNPTSTHWKQVNTPHFKVIYPEGFDQQGLRVANTLEHIHLPASKSMGKAPRKIPIVLQTANTISNGFVTLSPRRSEFYTMPPQDYNFIGSNKWLDLLAIHEYRHVAQFQHSRQGFNKFLSYLFGQNVQAAMAILAAPPWFWEGDATSIETAFSHSGRGRIPFFNLTYRSNLMEGLDFDYDKQHLGSYKHYIPNHYVLGYHFVNHLRRKTSDAKIMGKISGRAFRRPFIPMTFATAMKKETGKSLIENYQEMMVELKGLWADQIEGLELTPFERVNHREGKSFTNYQFPQLLADGRVLSLKSGIGDIQEFVTIDQSGNEEKVFTPGVMNTGAMLSTAGDKVVWNEFHFHPRWRAKNYSVIKVYNVVTKELKILTKKSRYTSAALSPDGQQVAATHTDELNQHRLAIIDAYSGKELKSFPNPDNVFLSMPRWSDDGKSIVTLGTGKGGKGVVQYELEKEGPKVLIPMRHENIGHPVLRGNQLLYGSSHTGIDNIFVMDITTGKRYQVTSSKYGAYNPALSQDGDTLYYNEHTRDGMDIVKVRFDRSGYALVTEGAASGSLRYYQAAVEQEGNPELLDNVPLNDYPSKKYSKLKGIINPHSWGPLYTGSFVQMRLGVFSKDILSNVSTSLGYKYNFEDRDGGGFARLSYQGFWPIIDVEFKKGGRRSKRGSIGGRKLEFQWKETGVEAGLRVPVLLTRSRFLRELKVGNAVGVRKVSDFRSNLGGKSRFIPANNNGTVRFFFRDELTDGSLVYNRLKLSFTNQLKRSTRDMKSKWGQSLRFEHLSTPYSGDFTGSLLALRSNFYFPGLLKHHSLYFNIAHQRRAKYVNERGFVEGNQYYFNNLIPKPRGYSYPDHETFTTLQANYLFPLLYPDFNLGPLFNIKRVKIKGFFDYGKGEGQNIYILSGLPGGSARVSYLDADYVSFGGELLFDVNILRFKPEFELGLRTVYSDPNLLSSGGLSFEFVLGGDVF